MAVNTKPTIELSNRKQSTITLILFRRYDAVEVINIHKLREEMGEKTIAVETFEGNSLVLIDEGHRGASGG